MGDEQEMAWLSLTRSKHRKKISQIVVTFWNEVKTSITWFFFVTVCKLLQIYRGGKPRIINISSDVDRQSIMHKYAYKSDTTCISNLRMTRRCFTKLCDMLHTLGGLRTSRHMDIDEQVAIFLHIIAHNVKNRNCLGALDGTHIKCLVPLKDKPKYRTIKNDIATNVLGVCSQDMQFIYVLPGWEGSAADGRVLRDALLRPHGLKLVDDGYTNVEGFLASYRGQRYHLNDCRAGHQPTTPKELFNMRHLSARNDPCVLKSSLDT
uniref:DDE Tnp4 domain-containing protein n=1 Tax=Lactuca sativa TaxID=4236 RepID=A0A9R1XFC3_LACSA|nr:hypothetical protein LSAT_V11C500276800 [Lactuca sativa]